MTFDKFAEVLLRQSVTMRAFRNSFLFAGSAALILSFLAIALAYALERKAGKFRRVLEAILEIPYALPGVVLAIACILLFLRPLPLIGISIYATPFIIVFAYLARFLPLALKPPLAAMAVLARDQEEASALDGANAWQRLRHIIVPNLLPAAAAGALLVFLLAFNELTVSALLWTAGTETLGVALVQPRRCGARRRSRRDRRQRDHCRGRGDGRARPVARKSAAGRIALGRCSPQPMRERNKTAARSD